MKIKDYKKFTEISAVFLFATFLFNPILSPYMKSIGFSEIEMSVLFSFLPLSMIIFSPLMGKLSDLTSRRHVIIIGIVLEIIAITLYIFGKSVFLFGIARVLDAVGYSTVVLISLAKVEDSIGSKKRGEYTGWTETIKFSGKIIAPVIGAILADYYFIEAPFFISIFILIFMFVFLFKRERLPKLAKKPLNPLEEIRDFLHYKKLRGMAILGIVVHGAHPGISLFLPLFIVYEMGLGLSLVGISFFILEFMHIFQFWFGKQSDRKGAWKLVILGCMIMSLGIGLLYITNSFITLALFLFIQGIGRSIWNVSAWSLMSKIGEENKREGEIAASYASIAKIGSFVSFLISGVFVSYFGIKNLFMVNSILIILGVFLSYYYLKD